MRSTLIAFLFLAACGPAVSLPAPVMEPIIEPVIEPEQPIAGPPQLVLPARHERFLELTAYARLEDGVATLTTEVTYALGDEYPSRVAIFMLRGLLAERECVINALGEVSSTRIAQVDGEAASLELARGQLMVTLRDEGTVTALIEGELRGIDCQLGIERVRSLPFQHRLTVRVHRVAGFAIELSHQRWPNCAERVRVPEGAALWLPMASPVDSIGAKFTAANAPEPVALELRSTGTLQNTASSFTASTGTVSISAATSLPLFGLRSFDVVGPEAVTQVQAALHVWMATYKGSYSQRIEDGGTYARLLPEEENFAGLIIESARTAVGPLCAGVPATWLRAASTTPACTAAPGASSVLLASTGECRFEVTMPGTAHRWATGFTISN